LGDFVPFLLAFITKYSRKELSAAELGNKVQVKRGEKKKRKPDLSKICQQISNWS
jgi:hypothetical protein